MENAELMQAGTDPRQETLKKLLQAYEGYYTINTEDPKPPFAAEAEFRIHGEDYFLLKSAKYAEMDSREFVFAAVEDRLDAARFEELDKIAWEEGLARTEAKENHRNTDITLLIVADTVDDEVWSLLKKRRHYKSYRFGFYGWNGYRVGAYEQSSGKKGTNYLGRTLEPLLKSI